MSFILVQFWGPLLVPVLENPMGDVTGGSQPPSNQPGSPPVLGSTQSRLSSPGVSELQEISDQYLDPFTEALQHGGQPQYQFLSQQQFNSPYQLRQNIPPQLQTSLVSPQSNMAQAQVLGRGSSFNMTSLGAALPDNFNYGQGFVQQSVQRFPSGPQQAGLVYPLQQTAQFPGQMSMNQANSPSYNMQYPQQYSGKFAHHQTPAQIQQPGPSSQQYTQHPNFIGSPHQQPPSPYFYQQGQFTSPGQLYSVNPPQQYALPYASQSNIAREVGPSSQQRSTEQYGGQGMQSGGALAKAGAAAPSGTQPAILRGPPRKPKQSGHALWVGNLPPGANVVDLKDHFSREATNDILSVFLISKSNCAFVNYKTEESCAAAMARFHDSRFQGVRLVCRLRRSSVNPVPSASTGPSATSAPQASVATTSTQLDGPPQETSSSGEAREEKPTSSVAKDKYFIVKSLTVEDLELSVRNGVWATQSHNEEALNKAYGSTENVYLIFSANKSGEYFGYARMTSSINDDPAAAIEFAPKAQTIEDPDLPKAISTLATEFAPKGRIIDDSARGTIFWEAETDDVDVPVESDEQRSEHSEQEQDGISPTKAWGKPFTIEWLSTNRLPFYRTRGLRNPWNSNREVKIARDGTELETSVGRRLTQMFHREPSPTAPTMPMMPPVMGYPQMRQY